MEFNWDLPDEQFAAVAAVAAWAKKRGIIDHVIDTEMDLTACHNHAQPLQLERMAEIVKEKGHVNQSDVAHDIVGIARHLNRETGKLTGGFLPRFSKREGARR